MGLGKYKTMSLQSAMQGLFKTKILTACVELNRDNVKEVLRGSSLVIDCTDNYTARSNIQEYCSDVAIPCLHCALAGTGDYARVVWSEDFVIDREDSDGAATCEDGHALPFHTQAAALAAQEVQKYLEGGKMESWHLTPFSVLRIA
jgi:molybdopterin/thiamine biosynthesis adenylyltransferase